MLDGLGGFVPKDLSFDNYTGVFDRFDSDATGHFSRVLPARRCSSRSSSCIGGLVINSMFAYALARLQLARPQRQRCRASSCS